jgi:hypothetical protein
MNLHGCLRVGRFLLYNSVIITLISQQVTMRKVLIPVIMVLVVAVVIIAGLALRPVSAPANGTPTAVEDCAVLDEIVLNPGQSAVQDVIYDQLDQVSPVVALPLKDTGLSVTPAVSKCVPLNDSEK